MMSSKEEDRDLAEYLLEVKDITESSEQDETGDDEPEDPNQDGQLL